MTVLEIPLDNDTEEIEAVPNNSENVLENSFKNEETLNETEELNSEEQQEIPETVEDIPAPKRPRGRPKGSAKAKEAPPKPQKQPKQTKPKKAPKKVVHYESSDEEELPDYVRQEVQPSQADLATSMLRLLQNHQDVRVQRKQNLYNSWFQHY